MIFLFYVAVGAPLTTRTASLEQLYEMGYRKLKIAPDGNCLFGSAVACSQGPTIPSVAFNHAVRLQVCDHLEKEEVWEMYGKGALFSDPGDHPGHYKDKDSYLAYMRQPGVYGTGTELQALADLYCRVIVVHYEDEATHHCIDPVNRAAGLGVWHFLYYRRKPEQPPHYDCMTTAPMVRPARLAPVQNRMAQQQRQLSSPQNSMPTLSGCCSGEVSLPKKQEQSPSQEHQHRLHEQQQQQQQKQQQQLQQHQEQFQPPLHHQQQQQLEQQKQQQHIMKQQLQQQQIKPQPQQKLPAPLPKQLPTDRPPLPSADQIEAVDRHLREEQAVWSVVKQHVDEKATENRNEVAKVRPHSTCCCGFT